MANISLDSQEFFYPSAPTSGDPMGQGLYLRGEGRLIAPPGSQMTLRQDSQDSRSSPPVPSVVDVVEISSDSGSDYGELGENLDELFPLAPFKSQTRPDSIVSTSA